MAAAATTPLKLLNTLIAESEGNIIKDEISKEPIKRIPSTIVTAVNTAISIL